MFSRPTLEFIPHGTLCQGPGDLGVGADGAGGDEFGHALLPGGLHELRAHDHVVVEQFAGVGAVVAECAASP